MHRIASGQPIRTSGRTVYLKREIEMLSSTRQVDLPLHVVQGDGKESVAI